jgi:hypothetical protein
MIPPRLTREAMVSRSKTSNSRQSRGEFLEGAFVVAQRYRCGYRGYESDEKAIAALRRKFPKCTNRQYTNALRKGVDLYDCSVECVKRNVDALYKEWDACQTCDPAGTIPRTLIMRLKKAVPGFRLSTYRMAAGWVFFWHHLK